MWTPASDLVGARWRKSTRTQGAQNCVEVAMLTELTAVRDSKAPAGPALLFKAPQWSSFLTVVKQGRLDPS
jgi:hypothetical protein